ncbi:hypothetical protein EVAR_93646_1 [Eumeta japonica]|uniref:Uncharacterized protein n=1 Tax=Eumeta variegata TaxID=151549 RepID=A0A4C1TQP7_EUMVA|nr:hypothetical protein EVAR_93646_1 [Eumeta japonica]
MYVHRTRHDGVPIKNGEARVTMVRRSRRPRSGERERATLKMIYHYLRMLYNDDRSKLDSDLSTPEISGYSQHQSRYSNGDYVSAKYVTNKTEYAAICSSVDDEEGELRILDLNKQEIAAADAQVAGWAEVGLSLIFSVCPAGGGDAELSTWRTSARHGGSVKEL